MVGFLLVDVLNLQSVLVLLIANAKLEQPDVSSHNVEHASAEAMVVLVSIDARSTV